MDNYTNINYSGKVKVSTKYKNKVILHNLNHNNGALPLFKFLCLCLSGEYTAAEPLRPFKVKLFDSNNIAVSNFIPINSKPILEDISDTYSEYRTTYHFLIPYSQINNNIKFIKLYSISETNDDNFSAEYELETEIDISGSKNNFILIIDWELRISDLNNN